ncbi:MULTISPECIES: hypothetical protein [unclassified Neisseria]|uniref:hypothetical protein n=1 Tax=unclassified Neisseria TaxID=2623750 RepID=UPI002666ACFE|nr:MULTISPECIES: hypothetical protein [unclassified Neisseria]MDO1509427.1 hypothetical protein [Neisseria sp. MVDL19-042950]MDO1515800.1 hypothetical protein [Neisseria sp. MVDL18-041461]MDO1563376.1 hypothetical protein [Neisseria sp. MVDL20-010259]
MKNKFVSAVVVLAGLGLSASAFAAGSFAQAAFINDQAHLTIKEGVYNIQGINVVDADAKSVDNVQQGVVGKTLNLQLQDAAFSVQGANVANVAAKNSKVEQEAFFDRVNLHVKGGNSNTQGVNVITLQ